MSYLPARIVGPVVLGTSAADLFTIVRAIRVQEILVSNTTGSAVTATLSLTPSGGSIFTGAFLPGITVAAHDVCIEEPDQVLNVGDKINGFASVTGVVLMVSGLLL